MDDCIFCKIIKKEAPALIIDENEDLIVILSLENHPLIITKKHFDNIYHLDDKVASAIMIEAVKIAKAVKNGLDAEGVNLVQSNEKAAKQDVFHFHLHVKPRWHKDSVVLNWNGKTVETDKRIFTQEKIKKQLK